MVMYLGVDIGGTKTLVAVLDDNGVILESRKFPTHHDYHHFTLEFRHALAHLGKHDWRAAGAGVPASRLNREEGIAEVFGNLPWRNIHIQADFERLLRCPVVVENDAKMAALSETMLLKDRYDRVLYVTISTGIGYGLTVNGKIETNLADGGGRAMLMPYHGKLVPWESFASGRAIVERYGKKAMDIHDKHTWQAIVNDLKLGFLELIAVTQPDVIVIGGSVGTYFERYGKLLAAELKVCETPSLKIPPLRQAQRPEEAVVYGCYDLAKQTFSHARSY